MPDRHAAMRHQPFNHVLYDKQVLYAVIDENQIIRITNKEIECYDKDLKHIELKTQISEMDISTIEKNGYDSFLLKEIHEEGKVVMDTIHHYMTQSLHELSKTMIDLKKYDHL